MNCFTLLGQRVNFTMYDFGIWSATESLESSQIQHCATSVKLHEPTSGEETTLCGGNQRISNPFISKTNIVDVSFTARSDPETATQLLLKYKGNIDFG